MFQNNKLNLLISIVAAIVLWAWVTMAVNPSVDQTISKVQVDLVNMEWLYDRGLTVDSEQSYSVDVVLNGPRSEATQLTASDIRATADMTGYPKGVVDVKVNIIVPSGMTVVQVKPETVRVEVVDRITVIKPVRIEYQETFPEDVEPGFVTVMPDEMEVAGVAEAVDSVDYIRVQVPEGLLSEEPKTFTLEAVPIKKDGEEAYNVSLSQDSIQATATLCTVKKVPLIIDQVGQADETIDITELSVPNTITIRGTEEAVADVTEIRGKEIDLSTLRDTTEIPVEPYLPEGVEVADRSKNLAVIVEVQGIVKKEFEYTAEQIEVAGLRQGLYGHVNTGSVTVMLLAPESEIESFAKEDIRIFVDATEIARAVEAFEMPVQYECEKAHKSITINPDKVRVSFNGESGNSSGTAKQSEVTGG
ncbi:MAG: hypothetical protein LBR44_11630 [Clostridiales Family XIII bacterium]|jgi:YbbR domain-containing protein|nr:hypothetical protein [Clostridiales Family XIII bacterium]